MRLFFALLAAISVSAALAVTLEVPRLAEPAFADREVSGDAALPTNRTDNLRLFRLEMTFNATLSNNVQVAVGRDAVPFDGILAAEETYFIIGWDCGEWFLRPLGLKERYTCMPQAASTACRRTLLVEIRNDVQGMPQSVLFLEKDVGSFVFDGLALSPLPEWSRTSLWSHLRVTSRGSDTANESVSAKFVQDGAVINLR
jgi:hypothetical protein